MPGHSDITVVIPTIPPRGQLLGRALASVTLQTLPPTAVSIAVDTKREGAPPTRQRALDAVQTPWVAFLDDDDEFLPSHLQLLAEHAQDTGADFVYSWFHVVGGRDPFPETHFSRDFDPADPIETTITVLVRTELAKQVGFAYLDRGHRINSGEDRRFTLGCLEAGAKISHLKERTWLWHHDSRNTSGLPDRW